MNISLVNIIFKYEIQKTQKKAVAGYSFMYRSHMTETSGRNKLEMSHLRHCFCVFGRYFFLYSA